MWCGRTAFGGWGSAWHRDDTVKCTLHRYMHIRIHVICVEGNLNKKNQLNKLAKNEKICKQNIVLNSVLEH